MLRRGNAVIFVLILLVVAVGGLAAWKISASQPVVDGWHHTINDGLDQAEAQNKSVLVMFTADWCGPCRRFKKTVLADRHVETALANRFACVKIDLTDRGGPNDRVAQDLGVRGIPALHIYDSEGFQRSTYMGPHEAGHFIMWLNQN